MVTQAQVDAREGTVPPEGRDDQRIHCEDGLHLYVRKGANKWFQTVSPTNTIGSTTMGLGRTARILLEDAREVGDGFKVWAKDHTSQECNAAANVFRENAKTEVEGERVDLKALRSALEQAIGTTDSLREKTQDDVEITPALGGHNQILYGPPGTGKTYLTAPRCVEICDRTGRLTDDQIREHYAGISKRYRKLVTSGRVEFVTFHQSYGYEEFVEGLRPAPSEKGQAGFWLVPTLGVLKRIADRARGDRENAYVLVIDEINRANVSKVMGELITLLEEDKREGAPNEVVVTLPHSGEPFTLPPNLHILGTMNTADRSIALIDTALRRRFQFEEMVPKPELLSVVEGVDLPAVLETINERLEYLIDRDHLIGHAWLMNAGTKAEVDDIMRRKIIPLISEYFYDDWRKVRAVLGNTNDFVRGERLSPPPGLDESERDERSRWTVRDDFATDAYRRLVQGQPTSPAADTGA